MSVPLYPNLQDLVALRGSYSLITADDWEAFDAAAEAWQAWYRKDLPVPGTKKR